MANFYFGTDRLTVFNFYFGTTAYSGTEVSFDFIVGGYGYNVYDFNFGEAPLKQLVIKSTATPGYVINSINVEYFDGDVLYINTVDGIIRKFSTTCTGTISSGNIVSSDYKSGSCGVENLFAGYENNLVEVNAVSGTLDTFVLDGTVSNVLYYLW